MRDRRQSKGFLTLAENEYAYISKAFAIMLRLRMKLILN
ncbi:unknown protein [Cronobacter turicensis z3032]|uniref:Uncharacterized protein n=1 Tax=Cronobacter turicensis (strain DSM 18703 / CCUG 55852 / LMG 23827 / z3032) TaxID=693216 RepID=C9XZ49_CROTZ|nr:unknown protein [Cronobacter turicensis z3032]